MEHEMVDETIDAVTKSMAWQYLYNAFLDKIASPGAITPSQLIAIMDLYLSRVDKYVRDMK